MHSLHMGTELEAVPRGGDRLLNRELWLEFNARVLDLAADPGVPLLERAVLLHLLGQPGRVLHGARRRPHGSVAAGIASARRRPNADGELSRDPRARARADGPPVAPLEPGASSRRSPSTAAIAQVDECQEKERNELEKRFDREIYLVLTPLAVGPGQPFPYISGLSNSLAVLVRDPETGRSASRA